MTGFAIEYRDAIQIFNARLRLKHLLKGTEHRTLPLSRLREILGVELNELDAEIESLDQLKIVVEASDVMVSAMLIIDRIIHPEKGGSK